MAGTLRNESNWVQFLGVLGLQSMATDDFFRARLDTMIDLRHPLAVLARQLPWDRIEQTLAPKFTHQDRPAKAAVVADLLGEHALEFGGGISNAGRPRLSIRLMASLLYLKNAFNLSDEELVQRWSENVVWQFFSGMDYYEPRLPCDATQIGRFRRAIGEEGLEQLLKATIETAVQTKAVKPAELERVIVDTTVQEKAIAHPVDSRLLEIARHKVASAAKRAGIVLKQTFVKEGKELRRKAGGYAHAKQFNRLRKTVKRQRTILGVLMREVQRKIDAQTQAVAAGGQPEREPSGPTAPVASHHVAHHERLGVTHVQIAGGVGEHVEHVAAFLRSVVERTERLVRLPERLPLRLCGRGVVRPAAGFVLVHRVSSGLSCCSGAGKKAPRRPW